MGSMSLYTHGADDVGKEHRRENSVGLALLPNTRKKLLNLPDEPIAVLGEEEMIDSGQLDIASRTRTMKD